MADGTHIDATVSESIIARFKGHKDGPTQCTCCCHTKQAILLRYGLLERVYFTVLKSVLALPQPKGFCLLRGTLTN